MAPDNRPVDNRSVVAGLNTQLRRVPVWAVWGLGTIPFLWVVWLALSDGLGVDPVRELEHRFGKIALWFLFGGLTITPLRRFLRIDLMRYRRAIGLIAFSYLVLHVLVWAFLDMGMLWSQVVGDLYRRPYLIFGMVALVLLSALALTSNSLSIRRLGRKWRVLHRAVYPAVGFGLLHYLWQMKVIQPQGWVWLTALAGLFLLRLPVWGRGSNGRTAKS